MKKVGTRVALAGLLAGSALGLAGVANATEAAPTSAGMTWAVDRPDWDDDDWRGPRWDDRRWDGPRYWDGPHNGACAWVPPAVSMWVPPAVC